MLESDELPRQDRKKVEKKSIVGLCLAVCSIFSSEEHDIDKQFSYLSSIEHVIAYFGIEEIFFKFILIFFLFAMLEQDETLLRSYSLKRSKEC